MSPGAQAVVEVDFRPIALLIRELRVKHDWSLGPCIGGALMFTICTLQDVGVEDGDTLLDSLKAMARDIAEGRAREVVEGN